MKYLLTAIVFSFCFAGMATTDATSENSSPSIEATTFIDGKKKRRTKRIKAKRKRRCQKAARRNFAG